MVQYLLFEMASGYALFERVASEEIGQELDQVQQAVLDLEKFGKSIRLKSMLPFKNAADALQNINDISEGICNATLKSFLELNLPAKSKSVVLGVSEKVLAGSIKAELGVSCESNDLVHELLRGIRYHIPKLIKQLDHGNMEKTQLGLGHSYSRAKVKFNVNRVDTMVTQAICMLDQLDKDINTFSMRIREWYGWHFPELVKIVSDNNMYARVAQFIKNKSQLSEAQLEGLEELVGDATVAQQILHAARSSMGTDISDFDMINIQMFAARVVALTDYRKELFNYLHDKMNNIAPNLSALIGEVVGARLISHAGSLTNLSKYPASTVQILGAEKALFRALKTKGNTPKYGLIFHSSFIGRAGAKNKGRISRYLANKCSIASRIDCFSDVPTSKFGEAMRTQVEDRLQFMETGAAVKKNVDVMKGVIDALVDEFKESNDMDLDEQQPATTATTDASPSKKKKKEKKRKAADAEEAQPQVEEASPEKKLKKKSAEDSESLAKKLKKEKKKEKKSKTEVVVGH